MGRQSQTGCKHCSEKDENDGINTNHAGDSNPELRLAFAAALQYGFVTMLIISVLAVLTAFFLKDLPMTRWSINETSASEAESVSEEEMPVVI